MLANTSQKLPKDWILCALYEKYKWEADLPSNSTGGWQNYGSGYTTLAVNLLNL